MRSRNVAVADCCGGQDGWTTDSSSALRQELTHGEARCATGNCARMPFLSADTGRAAGGVSNVSAITSHQGVPSRPVLSTLSHHHCRRLACYLLPACAAAAARLEAPRLVTFRLNMSRPHTSRGVVLAPPS